MQEEIIHHVLANNDTFILMATGGGKSICFQIPGLIMDGICIVISPLIALMNNQVAELKKRNIKAMALTHSYKYNELGTLLDNCIFGNYKFLYMSPERLQQEIVQERIKQMNVNLIAIDEAHCISQWGHDFRPAYKNIHVLRDLKPNIPCIALTASATQNVVDDVIKELKFENGKVFKQTFSRDNLAYMVFTVEDKMYKIKQILKKNPSSSIIYVRNRKSTIDISNVLNNSSFSATYYHGGLSANEKQQNFSDWLNNRSQVMVATNAFGMGIDKSDVKTVIHIDLPDSLESYFQEAGRVGRNGKKAYAVILTNKNDEQRAYSQFIKSLPTVDFIKLVYKKLCNYFQISFGEGTRTTHNFNFYTFCKTYQLNTKLTFNALIALDRSSIINFNQNFKRNSNVQIIVSNNELFKYLRKNQKVNEVVQCLLRTYGGVFDQNITINTQQISEKIGCLEDEIIAILEALENDYIIKLSLKKTDSEITFIEPREDEKTINRFATNIRNLNAQKEKNLNAVIRYISDDQNCKNNQLLIYFGESIKSTCGICSVCITYKEKHKIVCSKKDRLLIKELLKNGGSLSSREILSRSQISETKLKTVLKLLLENKEIVITDYNTYKLIK
jgi:ATP-dependent DNA helicase RecQ